MLVSQGVDLCSGCFGRGKHGHHGFVVKSLVGDGARRRGPSATEPVAGPSRVGGR